MKYSDLIPEAHSIAVAKGWYGSEPEVVGSARVMEQLALIHVDLSEAWYAVFSRGEFELRVSPEGEPSGLLSCLSAVVLRICALLGATGFELDEQRFCPLSSIWKRKGLYADLSVRFMAAHSQVSVATARAAKHDDEEFVRHLYLAIDGCVLIAKYALDCERVKDDLFVRALETKLAHERASTEVEP